MNSKTILALQSFGILARRQQWDDLASRADALIEPAISPPCVVVSEDGVDAEAFIAFLAAATSQKNIPQETFSSLAGDAGVQLAQKLVVYHPAGQFITANKAEVIEQHVFTRPDRSYAVVIGNMQSLTAAEDRELLEQAAWRLLVKSPPANPGRANLMNYQVFLWQPGSRAEASIETNIDKLTQWLLEPVANPDAIMQQQASDLIAAARRTLQQHRTQSIAGKANRTSQIAAVLETVTEFRSRLNRRLDNDAELLVGEVATQMRGMGRELGEELEKDLGGLSPQSSRLPANHVSGIVDSRLRLAVRDWSSQVVDLIRASAVRFQSESQELIDIVNWDLVNEVASGSGNTNRYPDQLLVSLDDKTEILKPESAGGVSGHSVQKGSDFGRDIVRIGLPVTAGLGIAGWFLGLPLTLPVSVLAGLLSAGAASRLSRDSCDPDQRRAFITETVQAFVERAVSHFQQETRVASSAIRRRLGERFRGLENLLSEAMHKSYQPTTGESEQEVSAALDEIERQVSAGG